MSKFPRQGRIAGWLKMSQSSVAELANHCGKSNSAMSRLCNAEEVPTDVLAAMASFKTSSGTRLPSEYLPVGRDKKPGPQPGWIERKIEAGLKSAGLDGSV